jgi:hypothetical protein
VKNPPKNMKMETEYLYDADLLKVALKSSRRKPPLPETVREWRMHNALNTS